MSTISHDSELPLKACLERIVATELPKEVMLQQKKEYLV
jgi:hypothetical protein